MSLFLRRLTFAHAVFFLSTGLFLLMPACTNAPGRANDTGGEDSPWSVRMANSVMARNDSLLLYNGEPKVKWKYDIAFLGMAIDKLGDIDSAYSLYMKEFMDYFIGPDGSIEEYDQAKYNLDYVNPAKNLITLYKRTGDEKYKLAIDRIIKQLENQPRTKSGGFWHKQVYPWQMWLDGIYMSGPFMTQYAREFNDPRWFDEAVYQILHIYEKTRDDDTGLLYHAWNESREQRWANPETGQSKHFWGRAMGWYMMALVDVLDYLPEEHPGREKVIEILKACAGALLKVRDQDSGLWYQVLDMAGKEGNYLEGSASAMYTYVFAKASAKGYLAHDYRDIAMDSFHGITERLIRIDDDGYLTMTNIVGGCGLGGNPYRDGSYEYYVTETRVDNDPKGVAPFILAAIELNK